MSKKKDELLGKQFEERYPLNQEEKNQLNAILEMIDQARQAQNLLYTNLVQQISYRNEVVDARIDINMGEITEKGIDSAALVVNKE